MQDLSKNPRFGTGEALSLYVHIPFCRRICHYCDFVKTSAYDSDLVDAYVAGLSVELVSWLQQLEQFRGSIAIDTVYFGGGTPGILTDAYRPLAELIRPLLTDKYEWTIEANPNDICTRSLSAWQKLGFNRLSIGVQSFSDKGLQALTRDHSGEQARIACEKARDYFDNINVDLIFGWPSQLMADWDDDLKLCRQEGFPHLSVYSLTYEARTPFGRRAARGVASPIPDERMEALYEVAREQLTVSGYLQEEVSTWTQPGYEARHNGQYWRGAEYVGIGSGAHGFLHCGAFGRRYHYNKHIHGFAKTGGLLGDVASGSGHPSVIYEKNRTAEMLLMEIISAGLRSRGGVDLFRIKDLTGWDFQPTSLVAWGLEQGILTAEGSRLVLDPEAYFLESNWCLQVLDAFR